MKNVLVKVFDKIRRILGVKNKKAFPIKYWKKRAKQYGERSVFNISHTEDEMLNVTKRRKNKVIPSEVPNLFILGCERSGSTWVSNIIDSHPDVEFFMEPFADYADIFPGFPERNFYIDHLNKCLIALVEDGYLRLFHLKYLLRKRTGKLYLDKLEKLLVTLYKFISRITRLRLPLRVEQFTSLNLNRKDSDPFLKNKEIKLVAMKELRLNFKVGFLSKLFPKAKFLIIIRNPAVQITSIMRLIKEGHLGEMKKYLCALPEFILRVKRFEKYKLFVDKINWGQDIEDMLIAWWLINYDVLIGDCKRFNLDYKIVYHEDISENPDLRSVDVFSFIGLNYSKEVATYVKDSSTNAHAVNSAVDTQRDSSNYYKKQLGKVDPRLLTKISKVMDSIDIAEELNRYKK